MIKRPRFLTNKNDVDNLKKTRSPDAFMEKSTGPNTGSGAFSTIEIKPSHN
jgi:hypothetical protein